MPKYMILLINNICGLKDILKNIGNGVFDPGYCPTQATAANMAETWKIQRGCQVAVIGLSDYTPVVSSADEELFQRLIDGMDFDKITEQKLLDEFQQGLWSGLIVASVIREIIPDFPILLVSERRDYEISQICQALGFRFLEVPVDNETVQRTIFCTVMQLTV